jgi:hypothetical protein
MEPRALAASDGAVVGIGAGFKPAPIGIHCHLM